MRRFRLTVAFPTGTVLVGGYSAVPGGLDRVHATDAQGLPILPATALRGALRETLEALLRGAGQPSCAGATGLSPEDSEKEGSQPVPCVVAAGRRCLACRLFGARREALDATETTFSSLVLRDAVLEGEKVDWTIRHGVALSRPERSAREQLLFSSRVPMIPRHRHFSALGTNTAADLEPLLEAAVRATTHIGSGRSRGFARVDLTLEWLDPSPTAVLDPPSQLPISQDGAIGVRITLLSPAALGTPTCDNNTREARTEVSGATLRGAVGFALAKQLENPDGNEALQKLVDEDGGAHFGFLYPSDTSTAGLPGPWPLTARACKNAPTEHAVVDTLLDKIAAVLVDSPSAARLTAESSRHTCRVCSAPLRSAPGSRRQPRLPATRLVTRLAIERTRTSARQGALFSTELIDAGAAYEGTIRNVPAGTQDMLARGLGSELFVGRGASAGWGRASVEVIAPHAFEPIAARAKAFSEALTRRLSGAGIPVGHAETYVPVTLLSPLWPDLGDSDGETTLLRSLGTPARLVLGVRRFTRDGGWDQRSGRMLTVQVVAAGGVFVFELDRPVVDCLPTLARLESRSAGQRGHQGFGHLLCFDPFILRGEVG